MATKKKKAIKKKTLSPAAGKLMAHLPMGQKGSPMAELAKKKGY